MTKQRTVVESVDEHFIGGRGAATCIAESPIRQSNQSKGVMTAEEFDEYVDNGGDVTPFIDEASITHPNWDDKARKINISMPEWMIDELDATARHFATTRQGVINMWIGERLAAERGAQIRNSPIY